MMVSSSELMLHYDTGSARSVVIRARHWLTDELNGRHTSGSLFIVRTASCDIVFKIVKPLVKNLFSAGVGLACISRWITSIDSNK